VMTAVMAAAMASVAGTAAGTAATKTQSQPPLYPQGVGEAQTMCAVAVGEVVQPPNPTL
jgi:hypothetical protein